MEDCRVGNSSNTTSSQMQVSAMASLVSMSVGMLSNTLALIILAKAYRRFRLKTKASFLLLASGLVMTNFLGHLINGSLVLYVYSVNMNLNKHSALCNFFGASMVFFGLSPLLLGSAMAVERCFGVTRPLFHSAALTSHHTRKLLAMAWLLAALVAVLPILAHSSYRKQCSGSWCFFHKEDVFLPLLFSGLGLLSLTVSILCNTVTVVIQSTNGRGNPCYGRMLLAVRMATWNQILDPWVYILLRRAVMRKVFLVTRRCCGPQSLYEWYCITVKGSMQSGTFPRGRACSRSPDRSSLPMTSIKP
ncbi:hypothetical protein JZ751_009181, partial [Albula glossodonta]